MDLPANKACQYTPDVRPAESGGWKPISCEGKEPGQAGRTAVVTPLAKGSFFVASGYESAIYNPVLQQ